MKAKRTGVVVCPLAQAKVHHCASSFYTLDMRLCRVTGSVVSSQKSDQLHARKLLLVAPLAADGSLLDGAAEDVALDPGLSAGVGDAVLVAKEGAVVAQLLDGDAPPEALPTPANVVIIAVVDEWEADGQLAR